jgi:hypothetical protein
LAFLKKTLIWIDTYIVTIATISIGILFFVHQFEKPNLKTKDDIMFLEGNVADFSFEIKSSYKASLNQYYIWLNNYPCTFQIKADFLPYFFQSRFEDEIKKGDKIRVAIPRDFENKLLKNDEFIFILSASKDYIDYLNLNETLEKENDNFDIYAGLLFSMFGIGYYLFKRKKLPSNL